MPPGRPPTATQRAERARDREQRLAELHHRIVTQVAALTNGEQWRAWLQFATRFHSYSFNNTVAIWMQRPDATWVAGYQRWRQLGRQVRAGEHGITILAPITRKADPTDTAKASSNGPGKAWVLPSGGPGVSRMSGTGAIAVIEAALSAPEDEPNGRVVRGFRLATVFDISQTDGDDSQIPARPERATVGVMLLAGQAPDGVWNALVGIAQQHGYRVERGHCDGANGFTRYADRLIRVRDDVDDAQAVKTMIHELGHMMLHDPTDPAQTTSLRCRGGQEVEAESIAFLVADHVGLDTSDYTFGYVTGWAEQAVNTTNKPPHEIVQATGVRVIRTAAQIIGAVDAVDSPRPPCRLISFSESTPRRDRRPTLAARPSPP